MGLDLDVYEHTYVTFGGKQNKVTLPSVPQVIEFEKSLGKCSKDPDKMVEIYRKYFQGLGLSEEDTAKLNMMQF